MPQVFSVFIRDFSHGELIPETPQISQDAIKQPENTDTFCPDITLIPDNLDAASHMASTGSSAPSFTSDSSMPLLQNNPEIDISLADITRHLAAVSHFTRQLLLALPLTDASREIFQAAYHQATFMMVSQRISEQDMEWDRGPHMRPIPLERNNIRSQDTEQSLDKADEQESEVTHVRKKRKYIPAEFTRAVIANGEIAPEPSTPITWPIPTISPSAREELNEAVIYMNAAASAHKQFTHGNEDIPI